jgi:formylglycine-generating enzyme required for sulfatase activity
MAKIFLSYRRQDSAGVAGRIYDRLRAHFGDDAVFMDIDSIPFGEDFREHIDAAVGRADLVLAVIGPRWSGKTDTSRRIDDPRDFVRIEVESALQRGIPVIPVLLDRTRMPTEAEVPSSLVAMTYRNAIEVDQGRDFHHHVDRLIQGIEFQFARAITTGARENEPNRLIEQPIASIFGFAHEGTGVIESGPLSDGSTTPLLRQEAAASTINRIAWRKRHNNSTSWLGGAALLVLAFMGVIIYVIAFNSTVERTGPNKQAESPASKAPGNTKSPLPKRRVPSPKLNPDRAGREWTNSIGMKFVRIDAGEFPMGTTKDQVDQLVRRFPDAERESFDDEQPQHSVKISRPFYLGIHEVTQGHYQAVMHNNPSQFAGSDDLPVENVSWLDAVEFCNKLSKQEMRTPFYRIDGTIVSRVGGDGYRLPTESEWEYACRGKSATLYPFGDDAGKLDNHAWYRGNAENGTNPVGQKLPNAWGLYDMLGNVWEWCADRYDEKYYATSTPADPPGASEGLDRAQRGGGWHSDVESCRPAYRASESPGTREHGSGFRVAASSG